MAQRETVKFILSSALFALAVIIFCQQSAMDKNGDAPDREARLDTLLNRLKPWCMKHETAAPAALVTVDPTLASYCACFVGKMDDHFRIDRVDPTSAGYRRRHPYVTIQLQSFRRQCRAEFH